MLGALELIVSVLQTNDKVGILPHLGDTHAPNESRKGQRTLARHLA